MLGARDGGKLFGSREARDFVADDERIFRKRGRRDRDADFIANAERAFVVGLAAGNRDYDAGGTEKFVQVEARGSQ